MKSERLNYKEIEKNYFDIYLGKDKIGFINAHHINKDDNSCEIGYYINEEYRNNGYATESLRAFIEYLISNNNFDKIICECQYDNIASRKVIEKSNMKYEYMLVEETKDSINKNFVYSYFK